MQWAEKMSLLKREQQKSFLSYCLYLTREALLISYGASNLSSFISNSDFEIKKRDRIVDRLMKQKADFKKRYDDEWETVLYATATKIAMGDSEDEEEE